MNLFKGNIYTIYNFLPYHPFSQYRRKKTEVNISILSQSITRSSRDIIHIFQVSNLQSYYSHILPIFSLSQANIWLLIKEMVLMSLGILRYYRNWCLRMSTDVYKCLWIFTDVYEYLRMFTFVYFCLLLDTVGYFWLLWALIGQLLTWIVWESLWELPSIN